MDMALAASWSDRRVTDPNSKALWLRLLVPGMVKDRPFDFLYNLVSVVPGSETDDNGRLLVFAAVARNFPRLWPRFARVLLLAAGMTKTQAVLEWLLRQPAAVLGPVLGLPAQSADEKAEASEGDVEVDDVDEPFQDALEVLIHNGWHSGPILCDRGATLLHAAAATGDRSWLELVREQVTSQFGPLAWVAMLEARDDHYRLPSHVAREVGTGGAHALLQTWMRELAANRSRQLEDAESTRRAAALKEALAQVDGLLDALLTAPVGAGADVDTGCGAGSDADDAGGDPGPVVPALPAGAVEEAPGPARRPLSEPDVCNAIAELRQILENFSGDPSQSKANRTRVRKHVQRAARSIMLRLDEDRAAGGIGFGMHFKSRHSFQVSYTKLAERVDDGEEGVDRAGRFSRHDTLAVLELWSYFVQDLRRCQAETPAVASELRLVWHLWALEGSHTGVVARARQAEEDEAGAGDSQLMLDPSGLTDCVREDVRGVCFVVIRKPCGNDVLVTAYPEPVDPEQSHFYQRALD